MYYSPVPLLILRTDVHARMEVNGAHAGECTPGSHIALPLSDSGEYYIGLSPLADAPDARLYGITRKIAFHKGQISLYPARDVDVCTWPGGVFELTLKPGRLRKETPFPIPCTVDKIEPVFSGRRFTLTLYRENGLRLSVEENGEVRCIHVLGEGKTGALNVKEIGGTLYAAAETEGEGKKHILLLNGSMESVFEAAAGNIIADSSGIFLIDSLGTLRGHERRTAYLPGEDGTFSPLPPETGFFTHRPKQSADSFERAVSFLEAVREGFAEEALSCLAETLREEISFASLRDFFGDFEEVRPPLSDRSGRYLGTAKRMEENRLRARLYEFSFAENGLIDNITEQ